MTDAIAARARQLFGPLVTVVAGRLPDLQSPLWPGEDAGLARAVPARRADFTAGRTAARLAMAAMGLPPQAIPQGRHGAPVWPAGLVGSIAHGGGSCIAALAPAKTVRMVGVDIEPVTPLDPVLVQEICSETERDWIAAQPDAADLPLRIFSAKEAVYKATYPLTAVVMGFDAVDLRIDADRAGFTAQLNGTYGPFPDGQQFRGGQDMVDGFVLSTFCLDANRL